MRLMETARSMGVRARRFAHGGEPHGRLVSAHACCSRWQVVERVDGVASSACQARP